MDEGTAGVDPVEARDSVGDGALTMAPEEPGYEDEVFLYVVIVIGDVDDVFFSPSRQVVIHQQSVRHITRIE